MQPEGATDTLSEKWKPWVIVFVVALFMLALCWSIDASIVYILLGVCAFSLFKMLQLRPVRQQAYTHASRAPHEETFKPSFWDQVKFKFNRPSTAGRGVTPAATAKVVKIIFAGVVGLVFLSIFIPAFYSDDSSNAALEAEQKASDFLNTQQYDSASYYYRIAIAGSPDRADLYFYRGNAFLNSNKHDSAIVQYDKALALDPDYKEAYYNKGWILYNATRYREALEAGRSAIEIDPDYADGLLLSGDCFYSMNRSDSALILYEKVYAGGYRSAPLSNMIAYIYDVQGNAQKAIPYYQEAIQYDTTLGSVYKRLGELIQTEEGNWYRQKAAQYQ